MILAAGLGTRLRPLTNTTPKALVSVAGKTMLEHVAEKLILAGVRQIVVNIHHHADLMRRYIGELHYPGVDFCISDESDHLLDTGGGIKKARPYLDGNEPFIVYNIDILCDIDIPAMLRAHIASQSLATLAVSHRKATRVLLWENNRLAGWENLQTRQVIDCRQQSSGSLLPNRQGDAKAKGSTMSRKAFSGIAVISPSLFELITENGAFSVKDMYLRLARHHHIGCFLHDHSGWFDIGTPEKLQHARDSFEGNATN